MIKENLKAHQKIAYRILENALLKDNVAHAYLFCGEKGTPKLEAAYLLVQSLVCEEKGLACETCDACLRVLHGGYSDLLVVDGTKQSIKKSDIQRIKDYFAKSKVEAKGKKAYILNGIENATNEAMNALLRFLEEPSDDIVAILICEDEEHVLETIRSRCQRVPFFKVQSDALETSLQVKFDGLSAHILANLCVDEEKAEAMMESETFTGAFNLFQDFLAAWRQKGFVWAKITLKQDAISKGKRDDKQIFAWFLEMLMLLCRDIYCLQATEVKELWGQNAEIVLEYKAETMHKVCIETRDKMGRSTNMPLLIDQFIYMLEVENGRK